MSTFLLKSKIEAARSFLFLIVFSIEIFLTLQSDF